MSSSSSSSYEDCSLWIFIYIRIITLYYWFILIIIIKTGDKRHAYHDIVAGRRAGDIEVYLQAENGEYHLERSPELASMGRAYDIQLLDLDGNGIYDLNELKIKCVRVKGKSDKLIGLSIQDSPKVVKILSLQIQEQDDQNLFPVMVTPPGIMPFGLIDFKVLVLVFTRTDIET